MIDNVQETRAQGRLAAAAAKAHTLVEALPWLERFRGALVVIKYGGNAMVDDELKAALSVSSTMALPPYLMTMRAPRKRSSHGSASTSVCALVAASNRL